MKVTNLTEAQIAKFPQYVAEWTAHGLSTQPANRPNAEKAIRMMYDGAGLEAPQIIWAESPLSGAIIATILKSGDKASVKASVRDSVGASVGDSVCGQHDADWLAFYKYYNAECGLIEETEALGGLWLLSQSCGWIYPYEGVCIATERPATCKVDENGLIHAETGPAIEYPDGFKVYGWHGTRLPEEWVENRETIDPSEILKSRNVEQRAAGAAMVGWPRMISHLRHEVVDSGPNGDWGDLLKVWMPDLPEPALMLKAECPRNGTICEFVPDIGRSLDGRTYPVDTVVAAQAARVFEHPETYQHPERRT